MMKRRGFLKTAGALLVGAVAVPAVAGREDAAITHAFIHRHGGVPCNKPAYLLTERPVPGGIAFSSIVRNLDGSRISTHAHIRCGSCGGVVRLSTGDVIEIGHA